MKKRVPKSLKTPNISKNMSEMAIFFEIKKKLGVLGLKNVTYIK